MSVLHGVKVIVFDFDGTLVRSNQLKYDAYFKLVSPKLWPAAIIENVLRKHFEKSRYAIIEKILKDTNFRGNMADRVSELSEQYNNIVLSGVKDCSLTDGSLNLLNYSLGRYRVYLSSTTPEAALKEIVSYKKLDRFFVRIFGYPNRKTVTVATIIAQENVAPDELLVVGDGKSDRKSAQENGCRFYHVSDETLHGLI